jgi:hypothetical protein
MRTALTNLVTRRRTLLLVLIAALAASTAAWAYWAAKSSGSAGGRVGSLAAPSISSATPGGGTVTLNWTAVTAPGAGTVSYYVRRDGSAASSSCPSAATPGTATSCTDTGVSTGSHSYRVTAVWHSWTATSSTSGVQVLTGAATHLVLTAATTSPTAGAGDNLTIAAKDASNNTVTSYSGTKSLTFSGASVGGSSHPVVTANNGTAIAFGSSEPISFSSGVATASAQSGGTMTLYKAETASIKVGDGTIDNGSGTSVTVSAAGAESFALATPSTQTAGTAFSESLTAKDAYGNTATSYVGKQTIGFSGPSSSPSGKAPSYPSSVTFTGGVGTASPITLYDADESTTLSATQGSVSGSTAGFAVNPTTASSFALASPGTQSVGSAFSATITARDAYGNTATSYVGKQTIGFSGPSSSPSGKAPSYPSSVTFTGGVGTASPITLYDAQTTTLTATQSALSGTSPSFTVAANSASSFTVPTPSSQTAGTAFNVTLTAKDAYGNPASSYEGAKTIAFSGPTTSPGGKAPAYPASVTFSAGTATAPVTIYDAGSMSLTATQGSVTGSSASFNVNAASAASLSLAAADETPGAGVSDNLAITALDAYGNTATSYTGTRTLTFGGASTIGVNHPTVSNSFGSATSFGNSTSITFSSGEASVQSGSRNGSMKLYAAETAKVTVSDGSINNGSGLAVTVSSGVLSTISVTNPGTQTAGTAFNLTVTGKDTFGNSVSGPQVLTFSGPASAPDGTTPSYPASVTLTGGEGKAQVTLSDAQTTTITAAQGSVKGTSSSFTVNPAIAAELSLAAADETPTAGVSDNLTITAIDQFGNTATAYTGPKTLTFGGASTIGVNHPSVTNSSGAAVNFGTATTIGFSSGVAKVSGSNNGAMKLYAAETTKVTVSDGTLNNGSGLSLTVSAGTLAISVTNPGTQTAGTAFNLAISAKDSFGNALSGVQALTFSGPASSPSEKAPSYPSSVTFTGGLGTASITLYKASSTTSVTVTQGSSNGSSGTFTVNAGTAAKLAWSSVSSSSGEEEGLCLFSCTWSGLGRNHTLSAKVSVTDASGNIVSGIGSGHTVTWTGGPSAGSLTPSSLALPSSGAATTTSSLSYTSSNSNFWSTDTFTAHSSPYTDATILLKK